jgi:integrase/recombinase XerD
MATLMHENGADIRFIQQMLGHEDLKSTQIYTQVAIRTLQQVHAATHPAATLEGHPANFPPVPKQSGQEQPGPNTEQAAEALLAALDQEAEEDREEPDE